MSGGCQKWCPEDGFRLLQTSKRPHDERKLILSGILLSVPVSIKYDSNQEREASCLILYAMILGCDMISPKEYKA